MTDPLSEATQELALAAPQDTATRADWEKATADVLRKSRRLRDTDADSLVWEKLSRDTLDGIRVAPIGSAADLEGLQTAGRPDRAHDWDIRVHVAGPDGKSANEALLIDLEGGATSVWVELGSGLEVADLGTILAGVYLDLAPVVLDAPGARAAAATRLLDLLDGVTPAVGTNLGARPALGSESKQELLEIARLAVAKGVLGVVVDASEVNDLGGSDAQELGYSMAAGVTVLRDLTDAGISLHDALGLIEFRYSAGVEQFATIAKLRAARRLWNRVAELCGAGEPVQQRQHVVTSRAMMSKYDPYVNMLRGTVAAFAAGVGGAEAVTVVPFDAALGLPGVLGRRAARNTSSLLIAESHLAKVSDPAGGAYAVEKFTDDQAIAGWAEFSRIEESGGAACALDDGSFHARIQEMVTARDERIATRTQPITGVSEYPNLSETLPERVPHPSSDAVRRYGAPFEALRDDPSTASVYLATMGSVAAHTARATFASNLFAAGGVSVTLAGATANADELVAGLTGEKVACLAGPDAAYTQWGAEAIVALRAAGVTHVILAGKPGDLSVDDTAVTGQDALAFLNRTREALA